VQLARHYNVVNKIADAAQKFLVLDAADRRADAFSR
jgi:hypothetical protein